MIGTNVLIAPTARVDRDVDIGHFAMIGEECEIRAGAKIGEDSEVHRNSEIGYRAEIGDGVIISAYAIVGQDVVIGDHCRIGCNAIICEGVHLGPGVVIGDTATIASMAEFNVSPLYIVGSRDPVCQMSADWLIIGTTDAHIDRWVAHYRDMLYSQDYSQEEIEEYADYIRLAARRMQARVQCDDDC
jgi:acyl-[acyl carrier protein]--UDP-N-acetylglucosamine O-acyltransferase